jgi:enhancing lycopene biosynthesis protein 2
MKKVCMILSGSGVFDGTEIHEAVLSILYLQQSNIEIVFAAPDIPQTDVINHISGQEIQESRNVLIESARIARGQIVNLKDIDVEDIDGLFFPGGAGSVKNLCTFMKEGPECSVNVDIQNLVSACLDKQKPIAALCISPVLIARICMLKGISGIRMTVGNTNHQIIGMLSRMGMEHILCESYNYEIDTNYRIFSSPAYMNDGNISEISSGILRLVNDFAHRYRTDK